MNEAEWALNISARVLSRDLASQSASEIWCVKVFSYFNVKQLPSVHLFLSLPLSARTGYFRIVHFRKFWSLVTIYVLKKICVAERQGVWVVLSLFITECFVEGPHFVLLSEMCTYIARIPTSFQRKEDFQTW
jgi:hypothetical protein